MTVIAFSDLLRPGPVLLLAELLVGLLTIASGITAVAAKLGSAMGAPVIRQKIRSWWVILLIALLTVSLEAGAALAVLAFLSFLALKEYFTLLPTINSDRGGLFWAYACIPLQFYWIYTGWFAMFAIFIPVYGFLFVQTRMILAGDVKNFVARSGRLHWGVMLCVYCLSHAAYVLRLEGTGVNPTGLFLFLIVLTSLGDVAGFLVGKAIGKRKISRHVSPNKTLEGFVGSVVISALLGLALRFLTPFDAWAALGIGAMVGLAGIFGDLCLSAFKRDMGVKDSGGFIPGHGGVLDRVDSLVFAAPLFFHTVRYFYTP